MNKLNKGGKVRKEKVKFYQLRLDESLWLRILRAAQKIGTKPASFIRIAIVEKLERIGK